MLISRLQMFKQLHFPASGQELEAAILRAKKDELTLQQLALAVRRRQQRKGPMPFLYKFNLNQHKEIIKYFPFEFTNGQKNAMMDIVQDMSLIKPMNRLLSADVGVGKTAVAFYAAMLTALNNKRAIILCPTTILAQQHYDTLKGMGWNDCGLWLGGSLETDMLKLSNESGNCVVYGDCPKSGLRGNRALISLPHIIISTTAIFNRADILKTVSLVIVDEQQKFGVAQRAKLQKYGNPHVLQMSATPIPRSIALTVFGDLDVSTIKESPIKRGPVITRWVLPGREEGVWEIVESELKRGHQAYIVYPRIESGEEDIESAEKGWREIPKKRFPDITCGLITGTMGAAVKGTVFHKFLEGEVKILVSTVIAEVGLDNPNATVMVIMGADRFGLSQLHQLRGRVCRSTETTYCLLVATTANETSIARLRTLEQTTDGFEIAEQDLRLRGPGEMFNTKQHGLPDLKFANLVDDYDVLLEARELAGKLIDRLDDPEYAGLKQMLAIKFPKLDIVGVN